VQIGSDVEETAVAELLRSAHRACSAEALAGQVHLTTRHLLNGHSIEVPAASE
jgi:hypothetical protein